MFTCPFVKLHFTRFLNIPKSAGSKVTVGFRPMFSPDTGLPSALPSFVTCKVDANGVGSFDENSVISLPLLPDIVDSLRLEIVCPADGKKQMIGCRSFKPKGLLSSKNEKGFLDIPFSGSFPHKDSDPIVRAEIYIEILRGQSGSDNKKDDIIKELKSSVVKGKIPASVFTSVFVPPVVVQPTSCPADIEKISWFDFPLICSPHENFSFGTTGRQLHIDQEYEDTIQVRNRTGDTVYFQIGQKHPEPPTYELKTVPTKGVLAPGGTMEVKIKLTLKCTTSISVRVPIRVWGNKWDRAFQAPIYVDAQGNVSTKLDPAEIIRDDSKVLGEGSFGTVYVAKYRGLPIAAKYIKPQSNPIKMRRDFEQEVEILQQIRHPCIVQFIGAVHFDDNLIIATEYCSFGSLAALLDKEGEFWKAHKDDVTMAFRIHAMLDVARALTYLHESNIIHRDVKPDNVLIYRLKVSDRNDVFVPVCKLTDFGTTRTITKEKNRKLKQTKFCLMTAGVGSQAYFSPEVCKGDKDYGLSSDVFSFAMSAYEVLTDADCVDFFVDELDRRGYSDDDEDLDVTAVHAELLVKNKRPSFDQGIRLDPCLRTIIERCWDTDPYNRPPMSQVTDVLEAAFCEEIDKSTKKPDLESSERIIVGNGGFGFYDPVSICFDKEDGFVVPPTEGDDLGDDYDD